MYSEYNKKKAEEAAEYAAEEAAEVVVGRVVDGRVEGSNQSDALTHRGAELEDQIDALTHRVAELERIVNDQAVQLEEKDNHGHADLHVRILALEEASSKSSWTSWR